MFQRPKSTRGRYDSVSTWSRRSLLNRSARRRSEQAVWRWSARSRSTLDPTAVSALLANSLRSVFGAARTEQAVGRGSARPGWSDRVSNRRKCPRCRRAHFDPRSALRARNRIAGEEHGCRLIQGGYSALNRRQRPRCRRVHFDPRSALRAQIRIAGEARGWIDPEIFTRVEPMLGRVAARTYGVMLIRRRRRSQFNGYAGWAVVDQSKKRADDRTAALSRRPYWHE
jgi:hypothetical protein